MPAPAAEVTDFYKGRDPLDVPRYSIPEAAAFVRTSPKTLSSWVAGRSYPTRSGPKRFRQIIEWPDPSDRRLSFANLVEAYALKAIRSSYGVKMSKVREALEYSRQAHGIDRLFLRRDLVVSPGKLFLDQWDGLIDVTHGGQTGMRAILEAYLRRLIWDEAGKPMRFYPMTRSSEDPGGPTIVLIDPRIAFGQPVVEPAYVTTHALAQRFQAGERPADIARDYDLEVEIVDEAIRQENLRRRAA